MGFYRASRPSLTKPYQGQLVGENRHVFSLHADAPAFRDDRKGGVENPSGVFDRLVYPRLRCGTPLRGMLSSLRKPRWAKLNMKTGGEAAPVWWTVVGLGDYGSACIISS
jgi:hypothetical protein